MFIGHYAVGFAAKKAAPKPSLGTYFIAVSFLDLLWPVFLLLGIERVRIEPGNTAFTPLAFVYYPYSHSLLMTVAWATLFSIGYYLRRRDRQGAAWLWAAVSSHWILDAVTHRPDLPLYPGSDRFVGFGLWSSVTGTIIVEGMMFLGGVILYLKATASKDRTGAILFWSLVIFLVGFYLANVAGPPPPDEKVLAWFSPLAWLFVFWAYWIDRHRMPSAAGDKIRTGDPP